MSHGIHSVGGNRAERRAERQEARAERREARQAESAPPVELWGKSAATQQAPVTVQAQSPTDVRQATPVDSPSTGGSVSRDALKGMKDLYSLAVLTRFDNIDTNHDNKLDRQEATQGLSHNDAGTKVASKFLNRFFDTGSFLA